MNIFDENKNIIACVEPYNIDKTVKNKLYCFKYILYFVFLTLLYMSLDLILKKINCKLIIFKIHVSDITIVPIFRRVFHLFNTIKLNINMIYVFIL